MTETKTKLCSCGCGRPAVKRGLTNVCYKRAARRGEIEVHPRSTRTTAETVALWMEQRAGGDDIETVAGRLGITVGSLKAAIRRYEAETGENIGYAPPDPKLLALRAEIAAWHAAGCPL